MSALFFSTIEVTRQAFFRSSLSYAIVNLMPIVPGHVLVIPTRPVPRLADLTPTELASLMGSVQKVGRAVEKAYEADALTIACQDGKAAGQSIPHVHFHVMPRKLKGDYFAGRNDDVYPAIERAEGALPHTLQDIDRNTTREALSLKMDSDRQPRTMKEMTDEALMLQSYFDGMPTSDS